MTQISVRVRSLPKWRDQTIASLADPNAPIRSNHGPEIQPGFDALSDFLREGELFWVSSDMAALAMSAGQQLDTVRWSVADRLAPSGLMIFDGGIGNIDTYGVSIPIEGCAWGTYEDEFLVWLLLSRQRLEQETRNSGLALAHELIPPLVPIYGHTLPITAEAVSLAELPAGLPRSVIAALAASWLLMQQPTLAERTQQQPDKSVQRAYQRNNRPIPEITAIDLRRQYIPQEGQQEPQSATSQHSFRWVVSGHWRNQAWGEGKKLRRQQWIPSYIKGPDGAPLLLSERVNVWRR